ncbi:hypothetical protein D9M68_816610 [compost metagenome]
MIASSASRRAFCSPAPAARLRASCGRPWPTTEGKPSWASSRAPRAPKRRATWAPWLSLPGAARSSIRAMRAARRTMAWASSFVGLSATAATNRPRAQMAPRWVFTPPVVVSIAASPSRPMRPRASRSGWPTSPCSSAASAICLKQGQSDSAEACIRPRCRSLWAPLPRRSTSAGLGERSASSIRASTARSASQSASGRSALRAISALITNS